MGRQKNVMLVVVDAVVIIITASREQLFAQSK